MKWLLANWPRVASGVALAAVAGVAGVISYLHIALLTVALHQPPLVARLMPFGVDGLIVVGSVTLLTASPGTERLGWLGVGPGVAASLFANVESGIRYGALAAIWAGVPAGSFFLATFLLERWLKAQASGGLPASARTAQFVPSGNQDAAVASLRATLAAGNPWSGRQLEARFGLTRAEATKVRQLVLAGANGHHPGDGDADQ
jgi:hypothetical protein